MIGGRVPQGRDEVGEPVASFPTYEAAQKAVSTLIAAEIPARDIAIVGQNLRSIERVTGRLGYAAAARSGAINGLLLGLLFSAILVIGSPSVPIQAFVGVLFVGIAIGMLLSIVTYSFVRRRRDFASVMQVVADRYEVTITASSIHRARQVLGPAGRARAAPGPSRAPRARRRATSRAAALRRAGAATDERPREIPEGEPGAVEGGEPPSTRRLPSETAPSTPAPDDGRCEPAVTAPVALPAGTGRGLGRQPRPGRQLGHGRRRARRGRRVPASVPPRLRARHCTSSASRRCASTSPMSRQGDGCRVRRAHAIATWSAVMAFAARARRRGAGVGGRQVLRRTDGVDGGGRGRDRPRRARLPRLSAAPARRPGEGARRAPAGRDAAAAVRRGHQRPVHRPARAARGGRRVLPGRDDRVDRGRRALVRGEGPASARRTRSARRWRPSSRTGCATRG